MGFRINTNVAALNAHNNGVVNNRALDSSLSKLSSGLRINSAADDASGMAIADSLRSQASSLGQAIRNANDAQSIIQIADKAMDEQIKILDTIKVKAIQAAQDGQSLESRTALQKDIARLMESLDKIANTTSYNGQALLSGSFTNKEFQIGAYTNQTVTANIGSTTSQKIGSSRFETGVTVTAAATVTMKFIGAGSGGTDVTLESVVVSSSANTGLSTLADVINKNTEVTGITAKALVKSTGTAAVAAGTYNLTINGVALGSLTALVNDSDGSMVNAINSRTTETGVVATTNASGALELTSTDGRGIEVTNSGAAMAGISGANFGRLLLTNNSGADIIISGGVGSGFSAGATVAEATLNLADVRTNITSANARAAGFAANAAEDTNVNNGIGTGVGVITFEGAQATMKISDSARTLLDTIRADLGSVQNELISTINNISVTQVNVAGAESQIRDVDFAAESANFSKHNILAQSGTYAMSQANAIQQNVLSLLQ